MTIVKDNWTKRVLMFYTNRRVDRLPFIGTSLRFPFERSGWYAGWAADQPALLDSAVQISLFHKIATPVDLCAAVAGDSSQTVTLG